MAQYLLLLHESPSGLSRVSREEMGAIVAKYRAWGERLAAEGKLVSSHKLRDEGGRHLVLEGGRALVTDGPFAEAKEVLGGYFVVQASSYDEAVELAKSCPHLEYQGRIEVREIDLLE